MSFSDEMDPTAALQTIRTQLVENSKMAHFEELIAMSESEGVIYMHDFAEALEDCEVHCRTSLLRKIYKLLQTSEENEDTLNRYILISAVKTGSGSSIRAKLFQSHDGRKKSYPNLEEKIRKSLPPKKHIQTEDDESPVQALKTISLQIMGMGKYDEMIETLVTMDAEGSGWVSGPVFADTLEDYSIHVRMVVIQGIFNHFDGEMHDGILSMKRKTLLNAMVQYAAKGVEHDTDPDSEDRDEGDYDDPDSDEILESNSLIVKKFGEDLLKSPSDSLSGVKGLKQIAKQLEEKKSMCVLEDALGMLDSGRGDVSIQDFAEALEEADVHVRTQLIRRIYKEIFNSIPDSGGIMVANKHELLIAIRAQIPSTFRKRTSGRAGSVIFTQGRITMPRKKERRNSTGSKCSLDDDDDWKTAFKRDSGKLKDFL